MRDPLIISYNGEKEGPQTIYSRFRQLSPSIQRKISNFALNPVHLESFTEFKTEMIQARLDEDLATEIVRIRAILATNNFALNAEGKNSLSGVFLNASRFNHSCVPNTDYEYDSKSECQIITADCDIDAGDELTLTYIHETDLREKRMKHLKRGWNFECCCRRATFIIQTRVNTSGILGSVDGVGKAFP